MYKYAPVHELLRIPAVISARSAAATLVELSINNLNLDDVCQFGSLCQFTALHNLAIQAYKVCRCDVTSFIASIAKLRALESLNLD